MRKFLLFLILGCCFHGIAQAVVVIAAAENSYAQIAKRLGGDNVIVEPLMPFPNQDPHLFSAGIKQAKALSNADIIIFNGAGYDTWVENLLIAKNNKHQRVIKVADLFPELASKNPHLWYAPGMIPLLASKLSEQLIAQDPKHKVEYENRLKLVLRDEALWQAQLKQFKAKNTGKAILMTEPVAALLTDELGLKTLVPEFSQKMMNEATPSPQEYIEFQSAIKERKAKVLIVNQQMVSPEVDEMRGLAKKYNVPIVSVTETQPLDQDYFSWMGRQLHAIDEALNGAH